MQSNDCLPWVEKYRPKTLDDVISNNHNIKTLKNLIKNGKLPHMLFYGPPGCGKTSTIHACIKELYGDSASYMVMELNGSDDRGIGAIREKIKEFAWSKNFFNNNVKLIILDEVDSMTFDAQSALRRIIELSTQTTRFCLICNYASKVIPALQSRCTHFRFSPLDGTELYNKILEISKIEHVNITGNGIRTIIKLSDGDMRRCYNLLQSAYMLNHIKINESDIYKCANIPQPEDIHKIFKWLTTNTVIDTYNNIIRIKIEKSIALVDIIKQLTDVIKSSNLDMNKKANIMINLAKIEYNLSMNCSENLQLLGMIGLFLM